MAHFHETPVVPAMAYNRGTLYTLYNKKIGYPLQKSWIHPRYTVRGVTRIFSRGFLIFFMDGKIMGIKLKKNSLTPLYTD